MSGFGWGWLTTITPLHVAINKGEDLPTIVERAGATRAAIPDNGLPYFISRYCTTEGAAVFEHHYQMEVLLNYLGSGVHGGAKSPDNDSPNTRKTTRLERFRAFGDSSEGDLGAHGQLVRRFALFSIQAQFIDGRLVLQFEWNKKMSNQDKIFAWIKELRAVLEEGSFVDNI